MIDYRSDTVTQPSARMRKAMAEAEVGDDVLREDPTLRALERRAAELTGKEAALFTPSGTFANQLALFTWAKAGEEVYLNENTHVVQHEAGASAHISGSFLRPFLPSATPWAEWTDILPRIRRTKDQHFPKSGLICLENALSDGTVQPLSSMVNIKVAAQKEKIPIHLDGARLFNAALHLGRKAEDMATQTDSLMFCLSKGLGAPVGSILCGPKDFIDEAFFKRKIMGGGMRQAGILAAAGLIALEEKEISRLKDDHEKIRLLADNFKQLDPIEVINPKPAINMLFFQLRKQSSERNKRFLSLLYKENILSYSPENGIFRFVAHRDILFEQINHTIKIFPRIIEQLDSEN